MNFKPVTSLIVAVVTQYRRKHNPLTPDSAESKLRNFPRIASRIELKSKVLLNSFPMNGHTLGFCPQNQKLENFVSPKVSLWESKGQQTAP